MKTCKLLILVMLGLVIVFAGTANALIINNFTSSGWVDPNYDNKWDESNLTGIARYYFFVEDTFASVTYLGLSFENDIFNTSLLTEAKFKIVNPTSGWSTIIQNQGSLAKWSLSGGSTVINSLNDPIIVDVEYTLNELAMYYHGNSSQAGSSTTWAWNDAQGANSPWSQQFTLAGIVDDDIYLSGGSTAPVPEPGTLMLLGSGLAGVGFYTRRRRK